MIAQLTHTLGNMISAGDGGEGDAPLKTQTGFDPAGIAKFVERELRPKVRNDGGDILFEGLEGNVLRIAAHADCATCVATDNCLRWWIQSEVERLAGVPVRVVIMKRPPYFTRQPA